ncbi:MAG TPA: hypothetical protein VM689_09590 [Aliidongia sp.]|nr:hypothetical protein [Aliidongia sp.]
MSDPIPSDLTGLWRREVMILPDGRRDTDTRVLWLQTRGLFADIRIPADRPSRAASSFGDYTDAELVELAKMYGFAGSFETEGGFCRWRRRLDYHPPGGPPDEANFTLDGDLLIELGIHADYREDWRRDTEAAAPVASFTLAEEGGPAGMLVIAGDHFILIEDRLEALPQAPSLAALVSSDLESGNRAAAEGRLAMKIAYGRIAEGWKIALSTFPWLEGTGLFDGRSGRFAESEGTLDLSGPGRQRWRLIDSSFLPGDLGALMPRILP